MVLEETPEGCIICTSHSPNQDGYIRIYQGKDAKSRYEMLHRTSWRKYRGEIPDGCEIDHMCRNRACCNPDHLQVLTVRDHKIKTNIERYAVRKEGIILAFQEGFRNADIARAFGLSPAAISVARKKHTNAIH